MAVNRIVINKTNPAQDIQTVKQVIAEGGLVVFPSDTVYGLLVDATNPQAVDKLIAFKDRPPGKAVSVFVSGFEMMHQYVQLGKQEEGRLRELLPGSYTIVLPSLGNVDRRLESESGTLGMRYIDFAPVQELVTAFGSPITATSANLGGASPHYSIDSFLHNLPKEKEQYLDMIVDFGKLPRNAPSTVVDYTGSDLTTLRLGDLALAESRSYVTRSPEETQQIAGVIAEQLRERRSAKHIVCILKGDLGAGKTQFTKGVARTLGVEEDIISPTFVVYYEYRIPPQEVQLIHNLYHFDLYNIQQAEELLHLGLDELREKPSFFCIEWGEKLGDAYETLATDADVVMIEIEHVVDSTKSQSQDINAGTNDGMVPTQEQTRKIRVVPVQS